jgi:O-antigen/teichoic acid export membrane protein
MNGNLKDKTVNAVAWNSIERVISLLINAFVGIILANILLPEDFGAVGIIIALSSFMNIFTDTEKKHFRKRLQHSIYI